MDVVFLLHLRMRSLRWAYKYPTFARPLRSHIPPRCKRRGVCTKSRSRLQRSV
jgi:hypothetical protein